MKTPSPGWSSTLRVGLGLFVVWQLFFLIATNVFPLIAELRPHLEKEKDQPDHKTAVAVVETVAPGWMENKGHVKDAFDGTYGLTRRWGQVTGQTQNWCLFAPTVSDHVTFPRVELHWREDPRSVVSMGHDLAPLAAGSVLELTTLLSTRWRDHEPVPSLSVTLLSENEPRDLHSYFRVGKFRLRRHESVIGIALFRGDRTMDEMADYFRHRIKEAIDQNGDPMLAYLQWRVNAYRKIHRELPMPRQVILRMHTYRITAPPGDEIATWEGPEEYPVARWQPHAVWTPGHPNLEMYNPVVERFESLDK